jgi:mRNA-degrading endonuclease toxin of MazEF toxin-antitoxin module
VLLKRGTAGLSLDSVAMCEQIRAITVDRLQKNIGRLDQQSMRTIDDGIKIALDLQ